MGKRSNPPTYCGNSPEAKGWWLLTVIEHGEQEWEIWRPPEDRGEWVQLKLVLGHGGRARKANYWLVYATRENRLRRDREAGLLAQNQPRLFERVIDAMANA